MLYSIGTVLIDMQEKCCGLQGFGDYFNNSQYQKDTTGTSKKDIHKCKRVPFSCCTGAKENKKKETLAADIERKNILNRNARDACCNRGASISKARFNEVHLRNPYSYNNFSALQDSYNTSTVLLYTVLV